MIHRLLDRLWKEGQLLLPAHMAVHQKVGQIFQGGLIRRHGIQKSGADLGAENVQQIGPQSAHPVPVTVGQFGDGQKHQIIAEQAGMFQKGRQHPPQVFIQGIQPRTGRHEDLTHFLFQEGVGQIGLPRKIVGQVSDADAHGRGDGPHGYVVVSVAGKQFLGRGKNVFPGGEGHWQFLLSGGSRRALHPLYHTRKKKQGPIKRRQTPESACRV